MNSPKEDDTLFVAYTQSESLVGQLAKRQSVNPENTFYSVKDLLGVNLMKLNQASRISYKVSKDESGKIKIHSIFNKDFDQKKFLLQF